MEDDKEKAIKPIAIAPISPIGEKPGRTLSLETLSWQSCCK
ncbi:MAG TPA: hypothetical protein V6C50_11635 [Crinalium sp.]